MGKIANIKGPQGDDGLNFLTGNGEPSKDLGVTNELYLDLDNYVLYKKSVRGSWVNMGKIKGADGKDGTEIEIGEDGFWYIDNVKQEIKVQGEPGEDGATWFTGTEVSTTDLTVEIDGAKIGDLYLNTTTADVFECTAENTWTKIANIKGAQGNPGDPGDPGDPGKDGTSFISGFGVPSSSLGITGDTYLNLSTYNLYKKVNDSDWEKVGSIAAGTEASPISIVSAKDFLSIDTNLGYTYYKLENDINLQELVDESLIYIQNSAIFAKFNGEIDGNGRTIYLPETGKNGYGTVIDIFNGKLKNVTISYKNVQDGQELNWSVNNSADLVFENVTIENVNSELNESGVLDLTSSSTNFSPFINYVGGNITFIDCTNNLSFSGMPYGSAFVGGYALGTAYNRDGEVDVNQVGFIKDIKVTFDNCVNNGNLTMEYASML